MKVTFLPSGLVFEASAGMSIMDAIRACDLKLDAPCGGNGTCKKCKVMVTDDGGEREVLACMTKITGDITVDISRKDEGHRILMGGITREVAPTPAVRVYTLEIPKPSTADLRDSWLRLTDALSEAARVEKGFFKPNLRVISKLYNTLEENAYRVDAIVCADEILDVVSVGSPVLGLAYDIGTTTVACYFADLRSGEQIAQASLLNPQTTYGGDVIMRVKYCVENGMEGPTGDIRKALNQLAANCAASAKQKMKNIYLITVVGNTCMHHLFLGISPASLAYAPYTPAAAEPMQLAASEFGFTVNPSAKLYMLPNIAGFVGADTVGAALAASMDEKKQITLLIDIGTNGEMVLGTEKRLIACSTAAGPAFEGALITCGMRGAEGAIDHVSLKDGKYTYSVIGGGKPIGICGSGLIDLMSELVRAGLVESAGRLLPPEEIETPEGLLLKDRITEYEGQRAFLLADAASSGTGEALVFTQKDVREVQLAKGAMAAGIQMMCSRLGIVTGDIQSVMIAGAFGSYMSPASACGIGLIPPELEEKVMAIGNAAGQGARLCVLSIDEYRRAAVLAKRIEYLELAADPQFQDVFVDELEFPGEDE
jgi:uncharacterized 2Fe-2S/4Fe-4S cluster protein (DUF4445 family)